MQKISDSTNSANAAGEFTEGSAAAGVAATIITAAWLNAVQRELVGVLAGAGIDPDSAHDTQLLAAIKAVAVKDGVTPGRLLGIQTFTSSGVYTPTPGTKSVIVEAIGGGAGGGNAGVTTASQVSVGGGGSSGSWAKARFISGYGGVTVTIGAGGAGGVGGGQTSFGSLLVCPGGGSPSTTTAAAGTPAIAGQGGIASAPTISDGVLIHASRGVPGLNGYFLNISVTGINSGQGASSPYGGGAIQTNGGAGNNADGFGAGGSGAVNGPSASVTLGGNGSPGIVIVWEFA